jgi:hypothetical protein
MTQALRTIFFVLLVANALALAGFLGWLWSTQRLSAERVEAVREIFAETVPEERARLEDERRAAELAAEEAEQAERNARPPLAASEMLEMQRMVGQVASDRVERLEREAEDLRRTLRMEREQLDADIAAFEARVEAFEARRSEIAEQAASDQFRQTVKLYESLAPDQAQQMMQSLIAQGETDQVVDYLGAMQARAAKKIIEAFPDPALAADLLERLRTRGVSPP